ncbi:ABC transporter ATP-binding protein [Candidatus Bathyarchaeota archaeon]|nr:ABC transporter ATP-binding protein [Candidatus Bathyarchaeota archaeon]
MSLHVEAREVCKEYSGRRVLDNVSFSVKYGEIFTLVGPNGAGKTTLLRILDMLDEPTSGEVWIEGSKIDYSGKDRHLIRRKIGFVPQKPTLFNASVFENIAYSLRFRGLDEKSIKRSVKEALEAVKLNDFERRNALTLSGGEAQRVSLAQTLVANPPLLLLDEPTSNLDPKSTSIIEEALLHANRENKTTIIMTSHDILQVEHMADRIAMINEGRIEKIGTFHEIFSKPLKDSARFMRTENVFSGFSTVTSDGTSIVDLGNGLKIEATFRRTGEVRVYVPPESIILLTQSVPSSARNIFEGSITQIMDMGSLVRLRIKTRGGKSLTVQITKKSFNEMGLNIGSWVFVAFKASSVELI